MVFVLMPSLIQNFFHVQDKPLNEIFEGSVMFNVMGVMVFFLFFFGSIFKLGFENVFLHFLRPPCNVQS